MLTIDPRGKTMGEVIALIKKYQLGSGEISDRTHLWQSKLNPKYVKVVVVWLNEKAVVGEDENGGKIPAPVTFISWDGKKSQPKFGEDLYGFVRSSGGIDWRKVNTINLMR